MSNKNDDPGKPLSVREEAFCEEYPIDYNGTAAAIRAGYARSGAAKQAERLLKRAHVRAELSRRRAQKRAESGVTEDDVIAALAKIAFSNMRDYASWSNSSVVIRSSDDLTPEQAAAVAEVKHVVQKYGSTTTVKLHDKLSALEKLCRHLGLFERDNEQTKDETTVNLPMVNMPPKCATLEEWEVQARRVLDAELAETTTTSGDGDHE